MGNVQLKSTSLGVVTTLGCKIDLHIQTGIISPWELGSQRGYYIILY